MHQGQGLRFPRNDRTDDVNKLFIIWPFSAFLKGYNKKTPEVIFNLCMQEVIWGRVHWTEVKPGNRNYKTVSLTMRNIGPEPVIN